MIINTVYNTVFPSDATWRHHAVTGSVALTSVLFLNYVANLLKRSVQPPGPTPLPFIGSALMVLGRPLYETFADMRAKYGDIFSIKLASTEVVVINGYEAIHDALVKQGKNFSGRPDITWTSITQKHGIFSSEGSLYHSQRGVIRQILSEIGWDKSDLAEQRIIKSTADLVQWLSQEAGKPINPQLYLDTAVCNITSLPVIGVEFKPTDDLMKALSKISADIFVDAGAQNVNNYFTFLRNLPGDPTNYKVLVNNATAAIGVVTGVISAHKEKLASDPSAPRTDFVDHYLDRISEGKEATNTEQQLIQVVTDLIAMGIEATATTLRWALLIMARHPEVQTKVQAEIDEVTGGESPCLKHQSEMFYTSAVITEIQRYINLVTINLPHAATHDVNFRGYRISKGTVVIPNLASIHYDEETYPEPLKFNPNRFIANANNDFQKPEKFMPYSAGTRMCIGKNLSQWQLFLMLTTVLQRFTVKLSGEVGPDVFGLIRYPGDFNLIFTGRKADITSQVPTAE